MPVDKTTTVYVVILPNGQKVTVAAHRIEHGSKALAFYRKESGGNEKKIAEFAAYSGWMEAEDQGKW
jgi:hypothetical protein